MGWIKVNLINRVTIKTKTGQGKEVALDYGVAEDKTEEDTDFDPEKPNVTLTLRLKIPVHLLYCLDLMVAYLSDVSHRIV